MILTKDNLIRFIKEKRYVTPTNIAESFETTTMIGSAALSELSKSGHIKISNLKIGSTPYYYDPNQREALIELGEKHFKTFDKAIFEKLRDVKVLNANSLTIQENLAIERIKDFAVKLDIEFNSNILLFWVWYQMDLADTKNQILDALNQNNSKKKVVDNTANDNNLMNSRNTKLNKDKIIKKKVLKETKVENKTPIVNQNKKNINSINNLENESRNNSNSNIFRPKHNLDNNFKDLVEDFIFKYFEENYLKIIEKENRKKGTFYKVQIFINNIDLVFDVFYFEKKPLLKDIIDFFISSHNPKIIFIENAAKKYFKFADETENLTIINI